MSHSNDVFSMNSRIFNFDLGTPVSETEMDRIIEHALEANSSGVLAAPCGSFRCMPNWDTGQCQSNHGL